MVLLKLIFKLREHEDRHLTADLNKSIPSAPLFEVSEVDSASVDSFLWQPPGDHRAPTVISEGERK